MTIAIIGTHINQPKDNSPKVHRQYIIDGLMRTKNAFIESVNGSPLLGVNKVCVWGWKMGARYRQKGFDVLVMERGYIGDRFKYTSLGWNGLNNYATFPEYPDDGGKRFHEHGGIIKPWKKEGDYILILGQVPGDQSLKGRSLIPWYTEMARKAAYKYRLPVHFRPHPDCAKKGIKQIIPGTKPSTGTLEEALAGAKFSIAYNSNSCLDSILAGVPCVAGDKGTMAWELCSKSVNNIIYPDREKIVHAIAWKQWSPEELQEGIPLKGLLECGL